VVATAQALKIGAVQPSMRRDADGDHVIDVICDRHNLVSEANDAQR
jgi:hypothetical protein